MFDQVNIKVKGVIENMSWFTGDDGKQYHLFGSGGGKDLADRLEVDLIGQVPMTMPMREVRPGPSCHGHRSRERGVACVRGDGKVGARARTK